MSGYGYRLTRPTELIDKLLLEKIPLAGIARVLGISETWLQNYVNNKYENVPTELKVFAKTTLNLTIECDKAWSFVEKSDNKQVDLVSS